MDGEGETKVGRREKEIEIEKVGNTERALEIEGSSQHDNRW
jgi:hypothetical protein